MKSEEGVGGGEREGRGEGHFMKKLMKEEFMEGERRLDRFSLTIQYSQV